jgi:hypothetical protein
MAVSLINNYNAHSFLDYCLNKALDMLIPSSGSIYNYTCNISACFMLTFVIKCDFECNWDVYI